MTYISHRHDTNLAVDKRIQKQKNHRETENMNINVFTAIVVFAVSAKVRADFDGPYAQQYDLSSLFGYSPYGNYEQTSLQPKKITANILAFPKNKETSSSALTPTLLKILTNILQSSPPAQCCPAPCYVQAPISGPYGPAVVQPGPIGLPLNCQPAQRGTTTAAPAPAAYQPAPRSPAPAYQPAPSASPTSPTLPAGSANNGLYNLLASNPQLLQQLLSLRI
ncbi:uncharacterized protein LOC126840632 [Adelges cooleyi]|uniref:uncharacterized protein LOC126840632 n=1 Tax=Adelges cooleyi TaxID=133065 RepID=UPI002180868F|nr:uncharacterized protein LOC126840632 [Adelges cooleyi]XP_050432460.1 uncharacterized protein LOC126840632 [Adelges cooleyi]